MLTPPVTWISGTCSSLFDLCRIDISLSLPSTLVFAIDILPVCFPQHFVNEASLRLRCVVENVEVHDVVQVLDPCIRPIMRKLRFPVDLIILPSVPD